MNGAVLEKIYCLQWRLKGRCDRLKPNYRNEQNAHMIDIRPVFAYRDKILTTPHRRISCVIITILRSRNFIIVLVESVVKCVS